MQVFFVCFFVVSGKMPPGKKSARKLLRGNMPPRKITPWKMPREKQPPGKFSLPWHNVTRKNFLLVFCCC